MSSLGCHHGKKQSDILTESNKMDFSNHRSDGFPKQALGNQEPRWEPAETYTARQSSSLEGSIELCCAPDDMSPSPETSCYLRMKRRKENPCSDGETKDEVITQRRSILSQKSLRYCNGMNKSFLPTVEKGALWAAGDLTDSWQLCFAHLSTRHLQDFYNNILYFFPVGGNMISFQKLWRTTV